jgi:hypothetical protein
MYWLRTDVIIEMHVHVMTTFDIDDMTTLAMGRERRYERHTIGYT